MKRHDRNERRDTNRVMGMWAQCAPCAYAANGGPPCYYHTSKFGVGRLTTTISNIKDIVIEEVSNAVNVAAEELIGAVDDELNDWP